MKRHPILVPLSHEHHHTLALCARILRHPELNHSADINEHYVGLMPHFEHEETMFAPLWHDLNRDDLRARIDELQLALAATDYRSPPTRGSWRSRPPRTTSTPSTLTRRTPHDH